MSLWTSIKRRIADAKKLRDDYNTLSRMSDRELLDLNLSRADIYRVVYGSRFRDNDAA